MALIDLECDEAQGYFFSPPQPAPDLREPDRQHSHLAAARRGGHAARRRRPPQPWSATA